MPIRYLPQHLINKLKAGEIVERPASIVKELLENSLDAGATDITIRIEEGGKTLIKVQDNGSGMSSDDLPLAVARYATSKITTDDDLERISSYGFRGEALAAIAEVSSCSIQTRTHESPAGVGYALQKLGADYVVKQIPFGSEHGSIVSIEHLFHTVPARQKFLKTASTERHHIKQLLFSYLLAHRQKSRHVWHNDKLIRQLSATASLTERVVDLTTDAWQPHLQEIAGTCQGGTLQGVMADVSLHFPTPEQMRFFVNTRPVEDKILKKAVMQAMKRQLPAGVYPFLYLFVDIEPSLVDVNVHPRKTEVKFLDPGAMFSAVTHLIETSTGEQKVSYAAFTKPTVQPSMVRPSFRKEKVSLGSTYSYHAHADMSLFDKLQFDTSSDLLIADDPVEVVGQLWQSYILASSETSLYLIDQHALAERIAYEHMKQKVQTDGFTPTVLLHPLLVHLPSRDIQLDQWQEIFSSIGMDVSSFGPEKIIVHSLPQVFVDRHVDIEHMCQHLWGAQDKRLAEFGRSSPYELFAHILDDIHGMKACKASITAGQYLSHAQMRQLLRDGQAYIPGMFVCQHGRPSIVKIPRTEIEKMVGR